ncbi:MAG: c-type cytochrome [Gammaproteobacteria bacterium]
MMSKPMLSKPMRFTVAALALLAMLAVAAVMAGSRLGERKQHRRLQVAVRPVSVPTDAAHVARGRYLFNTRGCADCHGGSGAGKEIIRSHGMLVVSPNITLGANSAVANYRVEDWVRTLRHGVKPDGTPVMVMPSEDFNRIPDDDLGALLAYLATLAPTPGQAGMVQLPTMVKVMYAFGAVRDAYEMIDHSLPPALAAPAELSLAHGEYVATSCMSCHGQNLSGGRIPGAPMEWPSPANLTPGSGSAMARYPTPQAFMAMLRSGRRPDGTPISRVMPFESLRQMSDADVIALHRYLRSLPPRRAGQR